MARWTGFALLAATAIAAMTLGTAALGVRGDVRYLSMVERLWVPVAAGALALLGAQAAVAGSRARAAFLAAAIGLLALAVMLREGMVSTVIWSNARCLWQGLAVGVAPLVVGVLVLWRRRETSALAGATIGALAGLCATGALHLHCSLGDVPHNLTLHAGAFALLTVAGVLATRRLPRTSPSR